MLRACYTCESCGYFLQGVFYVTVHVVTIGQLSDRRVPDLLWRALSPRFSVLQISRLALRGALSARGGFLLYDCPKIALVDIPNAVLIFKESLREAGRADIRQGIGVTDSQNEVATSALARSGVPVITCGLSSKDTLTLSSMAPGSAVVSLQRSVPCFGGGMTDPVEMPVKLGHDADRYGLLCCAAVLAAAGQLESMEKMTF